MSNECESCGGDIGKLYQQQHGFVYPFKCARCEVEELRRRELARSSQIDIKEFIAFMERIYTRLEAIEARLDDLE